MYLFQRVLRKMRGLFQRKESPGFHLDVKTLRSLEFFAQNQRRTPEEIANEILNDALKMHQSQEVHWQLWQRLTPREREIAALICLNYTSRQISIKLHISDQTVKSHVSHVLMKFGVTDRNDLRIMLSGWDFSAWDR